MLYVRLRCPGGEAVKPASCKAKGRILQNWVCEIVRRLFNLSDHDVKPAIMGESGIDIKLSALARKLFQYAVECKNTEKLNLFEAWNQATVNAEKENLSPLLIVKKNRTKAVMVLDAEHGFSLIQENARLKGLLQGE